MCAKLISIQTGALRPAIALDGQQIITGIYKEPIAGRVQVHRLSLEGDKQAALLHHGGPDKAVYAYPSEHYPYWMKELSQQNLPWGAFGENFTTEGLDEKNVCIGDRFTVGTAEVVVTQPRTPCYKLNMKFGREDMSDLYWASRRSGFYLGVLREGEVWAGEEIVRIHQDENRVSISDALRIHLHEPGTGDLLRRALQVEYLSAAWREELGKQI